MNANQLKTASTQVLILASGAQTRWESEHTYSTTHKQLLPVGDETIIERIIRQCRNRGAEPLVITHHQTIIQAIDTDHRSLTDRRWTVETLHHSPWGDDRTIVLLGDVVYSRPLMDRIFACSDPVRVYGHLYEIFAVVFRCTAHQRVLSALQQAIEHASTGKPGTLRKLYHALRGVDLEDNTIEHDLLGYVDYMQDYTRDVDTPADYTDLLDKVVNTGALNDE